MSSTINAHDVDPENQVEVGYRVWKAEDDCELLLLPNYDSDGEPIQCICMVGSGEGLSSNTLDSSESPVAVVPLCTVGPAYSVGGPDYVSSSSESPAPIQPQWVPLDGGDEDTSMDDFYQDYYRRLREM